METIRIEKGRSADYIVTIKDDTGDAVTTYAGTEPLSLEVWPGGSTSAYGLSASTVTWLDVSAGTVTLSLDEADTPLLSTGDELAILITDVKTYEVFRACLEVAESPGLGTAPATYATVADMRAECSWIESISGGADRGGYLRQRALAREWTDAILQSAYPVLQQERWDVFATAPALGLNVWLQQQLDADNLVLTGPYGRRIVRANALYACHLVLRDEVSRSKEKSHYQTLADTFHREAMAALQGITAGIDTNDDGIADVQIPLSVQRILRG